MVVGVVLVVGVVDVVGDVVGVVVGDVVGVESEQSSNVPWECDRSISFTRLAIARH